MTTSTEHPAVAFLLAAHQAALELAQGTTPVPLAGEWTVVRDKHADEGAPLSLVQGVEEDKAEYEPDSESYSYGLPVIVLAADWQDEAEANLRHIALHDPASVLRRVEAERELLTEHQPQRYASVPAHETCADLSCDCYEEVAMCGTCAPGHYYDADPQPWPCATVLLVAKGWGWTA